MLFSPLWAVFDADDCNSPSRGNCANARLLALSTASLMECLHKNRDFFFHLFLPSNSFLMQAVSRFAESLRSDKVPS